MCSFKKLQVRGLDVIREFFLSKAQGVTALRSGPLFLYDSIYQNRDLLLWPPRVCGGRYDSIYQNCENDALPICRWPHMASLAGTWCWQSPCHAFLGCCSVSDGTPGALDTKHGVGNKGLPGNKGPPRRSPLRGCQGWVGGGVGSCG